MKVALLALRSTLVVLIAVMISANSIAAANYYSVPDTTIYNYRYEDGTVPRTVGAPEPGWPVAFMKTDGPQMKMGAINCWTGALYDEHTLADNDPPTEYEPVAILAEGTTFCTTWIGQGGNSVDTYRGTLAWD